MFPGLPVETLPTEVSTRPLSKFIELDPFDRAFDRFTTAIAPYSYLLLQSLCIGVLFAFQIYLLNTAPDTVQSYDLQRGLQNVFSEPTELHSSLENITTTGSAAYPSVTKRILTSFSSRSEKTLRYLLDLISTVAPTKGIQQEPMPFISLGMELASALYRATSWKVWFLAASMIGWVYDHDFGSELFVFMTFVQIAQSLARSMIGAPPPFWLSSSAPHQLCHSAGFSLPPENLTLCISFFLFINYHMKVDYDEFATPEDKRQKKNRMKMLRIVSVLFPAALFFSTIYYGTHTLFDNFAGVTFSLLMFSFYRIYEMHQFLNEGEEDGASRPNIEIQQLENQILHPDQRPSMLSTFFPKTIFNWYTFLAGSIAVTALAFVYLLEAVGNMWDEEGLKIYPSAWKENVESNCGLKAGAASFLMSVRSFGFGYVNFSNTALLFGTLIALWIRNKYHIADTSSKAHPWKSLSRMILGLSVGVLFSNLLRFWFFEAETSPFFSHRTITREEQDKIDVMAIHIDMVFRSVWVLALSPILFHHMKLGHFLLEGYEEYENEIILKEAEMRRQMHETVEPNQFARSYYATTPFVATTSTIPTAITTPVAPISTTTTLDNEYIVREVTPSGREIPVKIHTTTTKTTQTFPVSTSVGAVVRQRMTRSQKE